MTAAVASSRAVHPVIRAATLADVDAMQAIYAHHVLTGTGTFELVPPDRAELAERLTRVLARGQPWLVALSPEGETLGYAYAGAFRERAAYARTLEDSIYLHPDALGRGVGRALLAALLREARRSGAHELVALIGDSGNAASIGLHRALGFRDAGVLRAVGEKFGRLLDVVIMQRSLGDQVVAG